MMSLFVERLKAGQVPTPKEMRYHLLEIHHQHPGFTEAFATRCFTSDGKTSYHLLADYVNQDSDQTLLDLACGSGVLTEMCLERLNSRGSIIAVDMCPDELGLARQRIHSDKVSFRCSLAEDLHVKSCSVDLALCHWALTLMKPVDLVLKEIARVLKPNGVFSAIVDPFDHNVPIYDAFSEIVDESVNREVPLFLQVGLGDARVKSIEALQVLCEEILGPHAVFENSNYIVSIHGEPEHLVNEIMAFYYAVYLLSDIEQDVVRRKGIKLLKQHSRHNGCARFDMPFSRITLKNSTDML